MRNGWFNWMILAEPAFRQQFQLKLVSRFASLLEKDDVSGEEEQFTRTVCENGEEIWPIIRLRRQPWISETVPQIRRSTETGIPYQLKLESEVYWFPSRERRHLQKRVLPSLEKGRKRVSKKLMGASKHHLKNMWNSERDVFRGRATVFYTDTVKLRRHWYLY